MVRLRMQHARHRPSHQVLRALPPVHEVDPRQEHPQRALVRQLRHEPTELHQVLLLLLLHSNEAPPQQHRMVRLRMQHARHRPCHQIARCLTPMNIFNPCDERSQV